MILPNRPYVLTALWILFLIDGALEGNHIKFDKKVCVSEMIKSIFLYNFYANNLKLFELQHYNMEEPR